MKNLSKYILAIVTPHLVNLRDMFATRSISDIKVGDKTVSVIKKEEDITLTSSGSITLTADPITKTINIHNDSLGAGDNVSIVDGKITIADATTTTKGIVMLSNSTTSTSQTTAATSKAVKDAIATLDGKYSVLTNNTYTNLPIGFMALLPFISTELNSSCPGWYLMNGGGLDKTSSTASTKLAATNLEKLPTAFKTRWGISTSGNIVYLPNWFKSGMNGNLAPFMRPVNANAKVGTYNIDTAINLTGEFGYLNNQGKFATGVFKLNKTAEHIGSGGSDDQSVMFDASRQWGKHIGNEFAPRSIGMLPCIFLGS